MIESKWEFGENITVVKNLRDSVQDTAPDSLDKKSLHLILYNDELPVACGSLYFNAGCYNLAHLCVQPAYQHQYIGDMLIKLLLLKGFHMMADKICCIATPENAAFFKKYGFSAKETNDQIIMEVTPASLIIQSKCGHDCSTCISKDFCKS